MIKFRIKLIVFICIINLNNVISQNEVFVPSNVENPSSLASTRLDDLFHKYSSDRLSMNSAQFENFLNHFVDLLNNDDATHSHQVHEDEHSHDHSHDHHEHSHQESKPKKNPKIDCLREKFAAIKKNSKMQDSDFALSKLEFNNLIGVVVADLDYCYCNTTNVIGLKRQNEFTLKYNKESR